MAVNRSEWMRTVLFTRLPCVRTRHGPHRMRSKNDGTIGPARSAPGKSPLCVRARQHTSAMRKESCARTKKVIDSHFQFYATMQSLPRLTGGVDAPQDCSLAGSSSPQARYRLGHHGPGTRSNPAGLGAVLSVLSVHRGGTTGAEPDRAGAAIRRRNGLAAACPGDGGNSGRLCVATSVV